MGSYYYEYISPRDPLDDCYDWPLIGIPAYEFFNEDVYLDDDHMDERWMQSTLPDVWVSDTGRVYNVRTKRFVKPTHGDNRGHLAVKTSVNGHRHQEYYHRLLAIAFIDNTQGDPYVRHLDDDPSNNDLHNLAWGTPYENHLDSVRNGTYSAVTDEDRRKGIEIMRHPILATNLATGEELCFESQTEAGRALGIPQANIWKVINGQRPKAGGYTFREISREEELQYS